MLQPISALTRRRGAASLDEVDIRQLVERYVRRQVGSVAVYCTAARHGHVVVRVASAVLHHEVLLLEYDLAVMLREEAAWRIIRLTVTQS